MTFYKVVVFSPGSTGPTSELCAHCSMSTARMVLNTCTIFFKVRHQGCDFMLESNPTSIQLLLPSVQWLAQQQRLQHPPTATIPPFPRSDGGTELRAEAASVCLCEGTI